MKITFIDNKDKEWIESFDSLDAAKARIKAVHDQDHNALDANTDSKITIRGMDTKELAEYASSLYMDS